MTTSKIKELHSLQAKAAALQIVIDKERDQELASLPEKYGFDSAADFIQAVRIATGSKGPGRKKLTAVKKSDTKASPSTGKRKRAKITPAIKSKVRAAVNAGTSGAAIADSLGISLPSVHNIKKELGLVKARKKKTATRKAK